MAPSASPNPYAANGNSGSFQRFISRLTSINSQLPTAFGSVWLWMIPINASLASAFIYIYAHQVPLPWDVVGSALAFSAAAFLSGGLLGFLFGIPKAATSAAPADSEYMANTNLEQISNWLTTIVV